MAAHENIRKFRREKNLTQKQLGELCEPKIAEANIRKYELGKANPKVETLERIAAALNVSVIDLLGDINISSDKIRPQKYINYVDAFQNLVESIGYQVEFRTEEDLYLILSDKKIICTFDTGDYFDLMNKTIEDIKYCIRLKSYSSIDYMSDIAIENEE